MTDRSDSDDPADDGRHRWSRRRVVGVAVLAVLLGGAAGAWWLGATAQSPEQAAARASEPAASWVTAAVKRRVLSATVIQRGDVQAQSSLAVRVPSSVEGEPVVTQATVAAGDEVTEGARVVEVSGRPVFVLEGDVPVYRSLRPGMSGADVAQLQAALTRLGFVPDTDGTYGEATKAAVAAFYEQAGYEPVPASANAAADLAAADQVVADAEAAVIAAEAALNAAAAGEAGSTVAQAEATRNQAQRAVDAAVAQRRTDTALAQQEMGVAVANRDRLAADPATPPAEVEAARLEADRAASRLDQVRRSSQDAIDTANEALWVAALSLNEALAAADLTGLEAALETAVSLRDRSVAALEGIRSANGPTVAQGEVVFVPSMPARVVTAVTTLGPIGVDGSVAPGAGSLVELTGGGLVVSTVVRPGDVDLVRDGMDVELLDETTGTVFAGHVSQVAGEAVTGPDGQLGYPATITTQEPLPGALTGANLRVTITAASSDGEVLVVPLAAVSSAADGATRVSVVYNPNDDKPIDVAVTAGLSADGFVAVEPVKPGDLTPGDLVVVGR